MRFRFGTFRCPGEASAQKLLDPAVQPRALRILVAGQQRGDREVQKHAHQKDHSNGVDRH